MSGDELVREYVRAVLRWYAETTAAEEAKMREIEAQGYVLVGGGPDGPPDDDEMSWQITDYRTGAVIVAGRGEKNYLAASNDDSRFGRFWHIDQIYVEEMFELRLPEPPPGLPKSLAEPIGEWAENERHNVDIAAWLGVDVDEVQRRRDNSASASVREFLAREAEEAEAVAEAEERNP